MVRMKIQYEELSLTKPEPKHSVNLKMRETSPAEAVYSDEKVRRGQNHWVEIIGKMLYLVGAIDCNHV